jgi:branched-chain amino acid transport system ATP-binding protein
MTAAIEVTGLTRSFGGLHAVRDVTFGVAPGERLAIIGPNGAGKTTLFNLISGELAPSAGRIVAFGADMTRLAPHRRTAAGLGRTYQLTRLFPRLTVLENTLLGVCALEPVRYDPVRPLRGHRDLRVRAQALLEPLGLWTVRDAAVEALSYGEQRQVEIALALATRPRALLLDEPTAGLSPAETRRVLDIIRGLPREIAVLLIEHDMAVVFGTCERILVLHQGGVVADGPAETVARDPRVQALYLGAPT